MTKVKFCGLTRDEDICAANRLLPDFAGLVFAEKSRRYVSPERAREIREKLDRRIKTVGVFVNADISLSSNSCGTASLILPSFTAERTTLIYGNSKKLSTDLL